MFKRKPINLNTLLIQEIQKNSRINELDYFLLHFIQIKLSLDDIWYINRKLMKDEILNMSGVYPN